MQEKIPVRLKKEPLLEAVWEMRFTTTKTSVAELLPGLIYKSLPGKYPKIVRLPAADIPAPIIEHDPNLRHVPKIRLEGGNHAVQIGEHVVSLSCRRPYSGWTTFSADIRALMGVVRDTALIDRLERFSLKYINLIEFKQPSGLSCLNVELKLGSRGMDSLPVQIRMEIKENGIIHIIQIVSPAEAALPGDPKKLTGVLLDIDTIWPLKKNESWEEVDSRLGIAHSAMKVMFFNLLTHETIEKLEPEYQE